MKLSDLLFIIATCTVLFGWLVIATNWQDIKNFLVGSFLDCWWKLLKISVEIKSISTRIKKHSKLTMEEEIELSNDSNSFNEPLGIGA